MELLNADDLVLMTESEELLTKKLRKWKKGWKQRFKVEKRMEAKVQRENAIRKLKLCSLSNFYFILSYFTSNFPGIEFDLHRSPKINNFIAI